LERRHIVRAKELCFDLPTLLSAQAHWLIMARGRAGCAAACSEPHGNKLIGTEKEKGTMGTGRMLVGSMGETGVEGSKMERRSRREYGRK